MLTQLVFEVVAIRRFNIVGEIAEEGERRCGRWQLSYKFDLHGMSAHHGGVILFNGGEHNIVKT